MSATSANPYRPYYPAGNSPAFVGREDILREIARVLRSSKELGVLLYGQRRIGKTSLLLELLARLPKKPNFHPVYIDLLDKASWMPGDILRTLAREIARREGLEPPDLGPSPVAYFADNWLPGVLEGLPQRHTLVLLLDEFSVLLDPRNAQSSAQLFPILRNLLKEYAPRLKFVTVVARSLDDLDMAALQLANELHMLNVGLLDQPAIQKLVRLSERHGSLIWQETAVEAVWQLTHGHPLLAQQLCSEVFQNLVESGVPGRVASDQDVEDAVDSTLANATPSLEWLWSGLPAAGRVVLAGLANNVYPVSAAELDQLLNTNGLRLMSRTLEDAPLLLNEWDLLEPGVEPYRINIELLRRWILMNKPLEHVREEVEYVEPLAENLYQAAARMYQHRRPDQAVSLLRQAVETNPNNSRANMLLADILSMMGHPDQVLDILERLYLIRPLAIWPRLARVLLDKARLEADEDAALEIYARILETEPDNADALSAKRGIWQRRAEAALSANDLETAYHALNNAGLQDQATRLEQRLRRQRVQEAMTNLRQFDHQKQYRQGLELVEKLVAHYPDFDWQPVIGHFREKSELTDQYELGIATLELGDRKNAGLILAGVAARNPQFNEVTRYLHLAVSGVDVAELQRELRDVRQSLVEAQQALLALQGQLTAFGHAPAVAFPGPPEGTFAPQTHQPAPVEQPRPSIPVSLPKSQPLAQTGGLLRAFARLNASNTDGKLTPEERLRMLLSEARLGNGHIIGLPQREGQDDPFEFAARLANEEGLVTYAARGPVNTAHTSYSAWRGALQSLFEIDPNLSIEQQARLLRSRLAEIDESYLSFLPKFSLAVLDTPIPGQTALRLMSAQEVQTNVQAIIIARLHRCANSSAVLLLLQADTGLDRLSRDLLVGLDQSISHLPLVIALTYPNVFDALDISIRNLNSFVEV